MRFTKTSLQGYERLIDFATVAGFRDDGNGHVALSGSLLDLYRRLDQLFVTWAAAYRAVDYRFPAFLPARELDKLDYFRSFPHLVTFPVALAPDDENLRRFVAGAPLSPAGDVQLTEWAAIRHVLTPAACYHVYSQLQGQALPSAVYITTRATCFRREASYAPLERQWNFSMREIVCLGTATEVKRFLAESQRTVTQFLQHIGLPVAWQCATDPFFDPSRNPKYIAQKLDPVKTEMVFDDHLALGSINFHRTYFGDVFKITHRGQEAFSGCVAFGLERWLYAFLRHFGVREDDWPNF